VKAGSKVGDRVVIVGGGSYTGDEGVIAAFIPRVRPRGSGLVAVKLDDGTEIRCQAYEVATPKGGVT
jgi:hypothetical protein